MSNKKAGRQHHKSFQKEKELQRAQLKFCEDPAHEKQLRRNFDELLHEYKIRQRQLDHIRDELARREQKQEKFLNKKEVLDDSIIHEIVSMLDNSENKSCGEYPEKMEDAIGGLIIERKQ